MARDTFNYEEESYYAKWLQANPSTKEDWTTTVDEINYKETFILRLQCEKYVKYWK